MGGELAARLVWAVLIVLSGIGLYRLTNRVILTRAQENLIGLPGMLPGVPVLLYFTTPDCQPCKTVQRPAIGQLKAMMGRNLQVIEIDCTRQPELAEQWGVLSVPTTFVIDAQGRPRGVNHGVVRADALYRQFVEISQA
jgi:thiol-disulfide isomerase/thioredoxin